MKLWSLSRLTLSALLTPHSVSLGKSHLISAHGFDYHLCTDLRARIAASSALSSEPQASTRSCLPNISTQTHLIKTELTISSFNLKPGLLVTTGGVHALSPQLLQ